MRRLRLATQLRQAVERESWELHYQPIVDLRDGHLLGVEALIRGLTEQGELIPPGDFIPLAEEIGLIETIGNWVIGEMCRQIQEWKEAGLDIEVAVNVSPRQLWSARFPEEILHTLQAAGVDPHRVVIEITESTAMTDAERTREILQALHDEGFQIAIDDFGTGYSSLGRLKHLPIDILKIDRSFVSDAHLDRDAGTMVQAMVQLAKNLGMTPLAEGVETSEELAFLRALDCPIGQGFLFSRPVRAADITAMLANGSSLIRSIGWLTERSALSETVGEPARNEARTFVPTSCPVPRRSLACEASPASEGADDDRDRARPTRRDRPRRRTGRRR